LQENQDGYVNNRRRNHRFELPDRQRTDQERNRRSSIRIRQKRGETKKDDQKTALRVVEERLR